MPNKSRNSGSALLEDVWSAWSCCRTSSSSLIFEINTSSRQCYLREGIANAVYAMYVCNSRAAPLGVVASPSLKPRALPGARCHGDASVDQASAIQCGEDRQLIALVVQEQRSIYIFALRGGPFRTNVSPIEFPSSLTISHCPIPCSFAAFLIPRPPPPIIRFPGR